MLEDKEDRIGKIALCNHNQLGRIDTVKTDQDGDTFYFGENIVTGEAWQSKDPTILPKDIQDYFDVYVFNIEELLQEGLQLMVFAPSLEKLPEEFREEWLKSLNRWSKRYRSLLDLSEE